MLTESCAQLTDHISIILAKFSLFQRLFETLNITETIFGLNMQRTAYLL